MNKISLALTAIMFLALVAFMAPNIFALNRGKVLRNIAIWLAIFAGLGLVYQAFGPGGQGIIPAPSFVGMHQAPLAPDGDKGGTQGFTPPKE